MRKKIVNSKEPTVIQHKFIVAKEAMPASYLKKAICHPGEIVREQFVKPYKLSKSELTRKLGVSYPLVDKLLSCKISITANTALRLAKLFRVSAEMFLNMQHQYNLSLLDKQAKKMKNILNEIRPMKLIKERKDGKGI